MTNLINFLISFVVFFILIVLFRFLFLEVFKQEPKTYTPKTEKEIEFNKDLKEKVIFYSYFNPNVTIFDNTNDVHFEYAKSFCIRSEDCKFLLVKDTNGVVKKIFKNDLK
jgi:hypothetical protein